MELLDCVAAKFHDEPGVFKLLVSNTASTVLDSISNPGKKDLHGLSVYL